MASLLDLFGLLRTGTLPANPAGTGSPAVGAPQVASPVPQIQQLPADTAQTFPIGSAIDLTGQNPMDMATPPFNPNAGVSMPQQPPQQQSNHIGGWQGLGFMQDVNADGNLQWAAINAALEMLKDRAPGESKMNAVAKGLQSGLGTYAGLKNQDAQSERQKRKDSLEEKNINSQIDARTSAEKRASADAAVKSKKSDIELRILNETVDDVIAKSKADAARANSQAEVEEIKAKAAKDLDAFRAAHPDLAEKADMAELELGIAKVTTEKLRGESERAQASRARSATAVDAAQIRRLNAQTEEQTLENDLTKAMTPEERKANKTKGSNASVPGDIQRAERYRMNYEKANKAKLDKMTPEQKDAHLAQIENDFMVSSKVNQTAVDKQIMATSDEKSPEYKAAFKRLNERAAGATEDGTVGGPSAVFKRNPQTGKIERVIGGR